MFKVQKVEETTTRTFRIPLSLFDKLSKTAQKEDVSLNSLICQCAEYALDNIDSPSFKSRNKKFKPKNKKTDT